MIMANVLCVGGISFKCPHSSSPHSAESAQREAVAGPGSPGCRWRQDWNPGILPPEHELLTTFSHHLPKKATSVQHAGNSQQQKLQVSGKESSSCIPIPNLFGVTGRDSLSLPACLTEEGQAPSLYFSWPHPITLVRVKAAQNC